jgi:hypothetical protein
MAANEIHVGDIGTVFQVTIKDDTVTLDISGATTKQIIFTKPSAEDVAKAAEFVTDGSDGLLKYTTIANDLDENGPWQIQARITLPSGTWRTDVREFQVFANLV